MGGASPHAAANTQNINVTFGNFVMGIKYQEGRKASVENLHFICMRG